MSTPRAIIPADDAAARERVAKWKWGAIIIGFLAVQILMSGIAIFLATSDPTHAVIPNYHQQSLEYDKVLAARQTSHQLGWTWTITPGEKLDITGKRALMVQVLDARSKPVTEATISLQLRHHARGNELQKLQLMPDPKSPGVYRGEAVMNRVGLWQIDINADRNEEHFVDRREKYWSFNQS